jgi:anti-anti-sigma factor
MALEVTLKTSEDVAQITLVGELDANTAAAFKTQIEEAAKLNPQRLVLMMQDLEYMASAGLRVLIFAKQQKLPGVKIYIVGAQEMVLDTIKKTGFDQSVYLVDDENEVKK